MSDCTECRDLRSALASARAQLKSCLTENACLRRLVEVEIEATDEGSTESHVGTN